MQVDLTTIRAGSEPETGQKSMSCSGLRSVLHDKRQRPLPSHAANAGDRLLWKNVPKDIAQQAFDLKRGWPLVLTGDTGTGKSAFAGLCYMHARSGQRSGSFGTAEPFWINALDGFKAVVTATTDHPKPLWGVVQYAAWPEHEHWSELRERGDVLVVLDDIGLRGRATDAQFEAMQKFLLFREGKPTIFTSNMSLQRVSRVYDDRIASRLSAGTVIAMRGDDRRAKR